MSGRFATGFIVPMLFVCSFVVCASLCCCAVARRRCGYISRIEAPSLLDAMPADVAVAMEWLKREQEEFLRSRHKRKHPDQDPSRVTKAVD